METTDVATGVSATVKSTKKKKKRAMPLLLLATGNSQQLKQYQAQRGKKNYAVPSCAEGNSLKT